MLPTGWVESHLSDVAVVAQGQSPPGDSYNELGNGLPFLQGKAEFGLLHPTPERWCSTPLRVAELGDILISIRAPVGPTNLADQRYCIGRGLAAVRAASGISPKFLLHYLRHSVSRLVDRATGTTFDAIGGEVLRAHRVLIPPKNEQERIVDAIDSYLTRLDDAVASLKRAQAKLKAYRASVLKAAVEGRLVPTEASIARAEKHDYEPADVLLRSKGPPAPSRKRAGRLWGAGVVPELSNIERSNLPEGWCWVKVRDLGPRPDEVVQVGPMSMRSRDFSDDGVTVLNVGCVQWGHIDDTKADKLPEKEAQKFGRYQVKSGDVLFTRSGTVGRSAVVGVQHDGSLITFHLLRARPSPDRCVPEYLQIVFQGASHVRRQTREASIGTTRAGFNTMLLAMLDVPLPPLAEQHRIVAEVQEVLSEVDACEVTVSKTVLRCSRLRQAVLKWAFEGKLVGQNANDEPAEKLVSRICAERATVPDRKAHRRRRGAA